jgi:pimeloyl-ACP methyl ester carboxylesterase
MAKIYVIPALACDERLFRDIDFSDHTVIYIKYQLPEPDDTLPFYAKRLAVKIDTSEPFYLIGVSFGGMCASEIARKLNPVKTILISTAKGADELPFFIKMFSYFPLYRIIPQNLIISLSVMVKYFFGRLEKRDLKILTEMLSRWPDQYLNRCIGCIVSWKSLSFDLSGKNIVHYQGSLDRVIPAKNIRNVKLVQNATHFMVLNKADEINRIIREEINTN